MLLFVMNKILIFACLTLFCGAPTKAQLISSHGDITNRNADNFQIENGIDFIFSDPKELNEKQLEAYKFLISPIIVDLGYVLEDLTSVNDKEFCTTSHYLLLRSIDSEPVEKAQKKIQAEILSEKFGHIALKEYYNEDIYNSFKTEEFEAKALEVCNVLLQGPSLMDYANQKLYIKVLQTVLSHIKSAVIPEFNVDLKAYAGELHDALLEAFIKKTAKNQKKYQKSPVEILDPYKEVILKANEDKEETFESIANFLLNEPEYGNEAKEAKYAKLASAILATIDDIDLTEDMIAEDCYLCLMSFFDINIYQNTIRSTSRSTSRSMSEWTFRAFSQLASRAASLNQTNVILDNAELLCTRDNSTEADMQKKEISQSASPVAHSSPGFSNIRIREGLTIMEEENNIENNSSPSPQASPQPTNPRTRTVSVPKLNFTKNRFASDDSTATDYWFKLSEVDRFTAILEALGKNATNEKIKKERDAKEAQKRAAAVKAEVELPTPIDASMKSTLTPLDVVKGWFSSMFNK